MRGETTDREMYSFELDWWLTCRDAACGHKSSFGGQVAVIESGGEHAANLDASGAYRHPFTDHQILNTRHERAFGMDRRLRRRWILLHEFDVGNATQHQRILLAHYTASNPSEADGDGRQRWPKGVESRLSQYAGVAIMLTPVEKGARAKLLMACQKGDDKALEAAKGRADRAIRAAHRAYYEIVNIEDEAWLAGESMRHVGAYSHMNRHRDEVRWGHGIEDRQHAEAPVDAVIQEAS
jgi:hypothetical protein